MEDNEKRFEQDIETWLTSAEGGWTKAKFQELNYEATKGLDLELLIQFIKETQAKKWARYEKMVGSDPVGNFYKRFEQEVSQHGILHVLRKGIKDRGVQFKVLQFRPSSTLNEEINKDYRANKTQLVRQFAYSPYNHNTLDMVLSVNGIPLVALELKNQFKGQSVEHAKKQLMFDRDPKEAIFQFNHRVLVYFAVDLNQAWMTTKLAGSKTFFLPFNQGSNGAGNVGGAGNPENSEGYQTAYLWERVLQKDALLDILQRFINLEIKYEKDLAGKTVEKRNMIFPRYHQLDVVKKLVADTKQKGSGQHYLIQHSAGSGKSNSIAWLSYHLQKLHNDKNEPIFNSVIIVTDRTVLDRQLQQTITSFDATTGLVETIGDNKSSKDLLKAINDGKQIIITTLQKFPVIYQDVESTTGKRFAVIVDEAHSSQTGSASQKLKIALSDREEALKEWEEFDEEASSKARDNEDELNNTLLGQGRHENISFYAFTATPKAKTLELFGQRTLDGKFQPFHVYSMRQAIEEGFILDVLQNYMTYHTAYQISKLVPDDPKLPASQAKRAIARYADLHPYNLAQKTEVMVEVFREKTRHAIGGRGKAMVVTSSRLAAVRYMKEFKRYISEKGYTDMDALVAFSGEITDNGEEYTEPKMNGLKENQLKEAFTTPQYNVLIVAEKYQTGFDEPQLHTMFVDKKLRGVKAVQTLSRLNRTMQGKVDTFVLDFKNSAEDIKEAFQPFYGKSTLDQAIDPNILYDAKEKIRKYHLYNTDDVNKVVSFYQSSSHLQDEKMLGRLASSFHPIIERYSQLEDSVKYEFRTLLRGFKEKYNYISQLVRLFDKELLSEYLFINYLISLLPKNSQEVIDISDKVRMDYYKLIYDNEGSITLVEEENLEYNQQQGINPSVKPPEEKDTLTEILNKINSQFPEVFTDEDQVVLDMIVKQVVQNPSERQRSIAKSNDYAMFKNSLFPKEFEDLVINLSQTSEGTFEKLFSNEEIFKFIMATSAQEAYKKWRSDAESTK
ncbi:DEAD/DEAH box helicase family protein [Streptococcus equi subsp. zooepidemicus]|uniref:type I restriction endonuclease subunit R n=1 Tax=Streptococcus equi TaxID=1336 RepID=UPI0013F604B2|nr:DEAD/DEAH box helicase family protein [Streptococcus equi]MCD3399487.1 DEAD/DEAH box helicase family protein [Streptococcus equi subsp. zooepidemicus]MCD3451310.1 DEAD/DEAH box helicase family protein [Streptococcus equi subsp. zooepidemicus]HEL1260844.1 type I restriction endonuclease subunit R [Streptococcus equi subsp. zooepidemicus]